MYPPARIDGFGIWYDTYGDKLHVRQVDVPQLDKMYEAAVARLAGASADEWCRFWVKHGEVHDKKANAAASKYWRKYVMREHA